jgi:hypothetical protein
MLLEYRAHSFDDLYPRIDRQETTILQLIKKDGRRIKAYTVPPTNAHQRDLVS